MTPALDQLGLPGRDGLVLRRTGSDRFTWVVDGEPAPGRDEVVARARARLDECNQAIELWDHWLKQSTVDAAPAGQDELLDSRSGYAGERELLKDFLAWALR